MSELISITVGALLEKVAKMYPDDQAVKYTDRPFNMTWRQFDDEVNRIAKGFLAMGIRKGDHVAIWATNVPEWLLTLFATGQNRRGARHRQHQLQGVRAGIPAAAVGFKGARHDQGLQGRGLCRHRQRALSDP